MHVDSEDNRTKKDMEGLTGGPVIKNSLASAGDMGLSLVWEDPTFWMATKPVYHYDWTCDLEFGSHNN